VCEGSAGEIVFGVRPWWRVLGVWLPRAIGELGLDFTCMGLVVLVSIGGIFLLEICFG